MIATSPSATLVESHRPPMPTSITATSTGCVRERRERHHREDLEERQLRLALRRGALVDQVDVRRHVLPHLDEPLVADRLAVDDDPLVHARQVRAGEPTGAQAVLADQPLDHARRRRLAVGARDVHHPVGLLRVAQQLHDGERPVERRVDLVLGGARQDPAVHLVGGRPGLLLGLPAQVLGSLRARAGSCLVPSGVDGFHGRLQRRAPSRSRPRAPASRARSCRGAARPRPRAPSGTSSVSRIRSPTCRPAALRASWTTRTTSRA